MKVAVSSSGNNLDSQIDPRFGRCACFLIVETDDMHFESFDNENIALGGGAGIQSAQFVASKGAKAVITGNCGPNAVRTLSAAGVELIIGQTGTVREAVERYKRGDLRPASEANVPDHYGMGTGRGTATGRGMGRGTGMGRGMGMGRGGGMGRGMGMGRGGGMGQGMGTSWQNDPSRAEAEVLSRDQELKVLKEHVKDLIEQVESVEERIRKLEKDD
jgi:predicted Fe-Mo cluster-binding NifX family protein